MADKRQARPRPCASCPYRRDVPAGVWEVEEYEKLPKFDPPATASDGRPWREGFEPTMNDDPAIFLCHQADGHLCSGWLGCHGAENLMGILIGVIEGRIDQSVYQYETDVPLFSSGQEAAEHGLEGIDNITPEAQAIIDKIMHKREVQDG